MTKIKEIKLYSTFKFKTSVTVCIDRNGSWATYLACQPLFAVDSNPPK